MGEHLPDELQQLVAHIASALAATATIIPRQARAARVVLQTATMADVDTPPHLERVPLPDGPLPIDAHVYRGGTPTGEVLLWIKDGLFLGLEQPWYTDDPPAEWPAPADMRVSA